MDKEQLENLINPLLKTYDSIELDLIKNILNRIENYSDISGSLKWYIEKLTDLKLLDKENLAVINKNKKEVEKILKNILNQASINRNGFDKLNSFYEQGLLSINPNIIYDSISVNNLINEAIKDTDNIMDLINTKAIEGAKKEYKNILNKAYLEVSTGIYTYNESIRRALKEMADKGIQIVHYESGRKMSIESVVRRDVITRVNKLVGDVEIQHAKDLGTNLVYVDQHLGARVRTKYMKNDYEAHVEWQGKKYMIDGSSDQYPNLYEATGYGEMLGLKGINCYHDMRPTFEWEKIDEQIDLEKNKKVYERTQKQRAFERKSRYLKREQLIAKQQQDNELITKNREKFAKFNKEYNKFIRDNKLTRDYSREYISPGKNSCPIPHYEMYNVKGNIPKMTNEQIYDIFNKEQSVIDKYIDIESKWSGKINVVDVSISAGKEWNCSITISNQTLSQEVRHELLHARSISIYGKRYFKKFKWTEEATVEFFNKQISDLEKEQYYPNMYYGMVETLEEIADKLKVDRFEFSKQLFSTHLKDRYSYIMNINNSKEIQELLEVAFYGEKN